MPKTKEDSGITLIALIITIIVLLILAGVTISAISGNESTMEKAKQAKENTDKSNELEQIKIAVISAISEGNDGKISEENLIEALGEMYSSIMDNGDDSWTVTINSGTKYWIAKDGSKVENMEDHLFQVGNINDYVQHVSNVLTIEDNTLKFKMVNQGGSVAHNISKRNYGNRSYTISANSSIKGGRFLIRLRKLDDSGWATNSDYNIPGWEYNFYYKAWFKTISSTTNMEVTINIPDCLYWQPGFGFATVDDLIGTYQTIENIKIRQN